MSPSNVSPLMLSVDVDWASIAPPGELALSESKVEPVIMVVPTSSRKNAPPGPGVLLPDIVSPVTVSGPLVERPSESYTAAPGSLATFPSIVSWPSDSDPDSTSIAPPLSCAALLSSVELEIDVVGAGVTLLVV